MEDMNLGYYQLHDLKQRLRKRGYIALIFVPLGATIFPVRIVQQEQTNI
jgi:hypothetical protein